MSGFSFQVTAVGDRTEIGQVANAVATVEDGETTPLNLQLEKLSQLIGVVGLSVSTLTFIVLVIRGFLTGELILSWQQSYFLTVLLISILLILLPIWIPIVADGLYLVKINPTIPPLAAGGRGWLQMTLSSSLCMLGGIGLGYVLGLMPQTGSWLPYSVGTTLLDYFMVAVTIIVVAVPEGLAMSVTLSLAYSMRKMAAAHNLVRRMHACETIGAATVICADKTGTLTCNQMHVYEVHFSCLHCEAIGEISDCQGLIAEAIAANSTADLERKARQPTKVIGNATEGALLLWLDGQNLDYLSYRNQFPVQSQITFSTEKKYMGTFGTSGVLGKKILHIKGAPEIVLQRCSQILTTRGVEKLYKQGARTILESLHTYQARGMRTLGFAYDLVPPQLTESDLQVVDHHLIWLGFVAIIDPLRPEVSESIQTCIDAGIQVKVVTGDSPETAREIAHQIGLLQDKEVCERPYLSLTGKELNQLSDAEAKIAVKSLKVLSRACPLDKLRLVKLLQEDGEVVGVTGDGTNDAAALKQGQVGLSMGSGTAIAKEASDIILLNDSFGSIVNAVMWGRSLYENIQRFILFQLTINVVALGIAFLGPFIGVSLPLTVTQMLWVNLIMDTFAALALATEPPHWHVMDNPPRNAQAFIISPVMVRNILTTGLGFLILMLGFLWYLCQDGLVGMYELSVFFAVFVLLQFWNLFNARCLGLNQSAFQGLGENKSFVAIASTIFLGQILIVQFGGTIFRTVPLTLRDWLIIILGTSIVLWLGELQRYLRR